MSRRKKHTLADIARRRLCTDGKRNFEEKTVTFTFAEVFNINWLIKEGLKTTHEAEKIMRAVKKLKRLL